MPDSFTPSPDDLTLALTDTLLAALEGLPQLVLDAEQLASRLAPGLSVRLAEAAEAAGVTPLAMARALATPPEASGPGPDSPEARVLAALGRHASGRTPGGGPAAHQPAGRARSWGRAAPRNRTRHRRPAVGRRAEVVRSARAELIRVHTASARSIRHR